LTEKREKETFAKKKEKKKHRISPFQKKPTASKVMDYVTQTTLKKPPPPQSLPFIPGNHEERKNESEQVRILNSKGNICWNTK